MLTGNVTLIAGGSRGIGAACARKLASLGADIAVVYHTGGIKLYPPGLPALAVQLRVDEIGLVILLRVKQFLNHIFHIHSP